MTWSPATNANRSPSFSAAFSASPCASSSLKGRWTTILPRRRPLAATTFTSHGGVRPGPLTGEELALRRRSCAALRPPSPGASGRSRSAKARAAPASPGRGLGVVDGVVLELLPVVGRRDCDRSREARVGRADLAVDGYLGERHRRRHQRQQREEHEIDDQAKLETTHDRAVRPFFSKTRRRPVHRRPSYPSSQGGSPQRLVRRWGARAAPRASSRRASRR